MNLDIKNIRVYLISPGVNKYRDRALTVFGRLMDFGFKNIIYFKSAPGLNNTASLTNTVLEIFKLELNNTEPFFILEDDCAFFTKYDTITIPDDWDLLYAGVSCWSYPYTIETLYKYKNGGPHIQLNSNHVPVDTNLVKSKGMTGTHAILYRSRQFMLKFIREMETIAKSIKDLPHDLLFSVLHSSFNVYALKKPMFYQDKTLGGQENATKITFNGKSFC